MNMLKSRLKEFKLSGINRSLEDRISYAREKSLSYEEFLELLLEDEKNNRQQNSYKKRYKRAKFPYNKRLEDFDFSFQPSIDKRVINDCATCQFVDDAKNIVFMGAPGVGKTMLCKHLAFSALKAGYSVTFARADKLFSHLRLSAIDGTFERTIRSYIRPDILIIDDFAVREMTREEAGHFYEIVLERHGKKSNIITSARSPEEWQALFPDPILGNSALDRLAHSSYQICMDGPSIREQNRPK